MKMEISVAKPIYPSMGPPENLNDSTQMFLCAGFEPKFTPLRVRATIRLMNVKCVFYTWLSDKGPTPNRSKIWPKPPQEDHLCRVLDFGSRTISTGIQQIGLHYINGVKLSNPTC